MLLWEIIILDFLKYNNFYQNVSAFIYLFKVTYVFSLF